MRPVAYLTLALLCCGVAPAANHSIPRQSVTVLLQFEQDRSERSLTEMKHELERIFRDTGYAFDWRLLDETNPARTYDDLVVVRMKGRCTMEAVPVLYDERGPLAFTHSSDGQVLPFSEVECDKVRRSIGRVINISNQAKADQLLGRALGRVLAHEMYHIFAKTGHHGERGVAKTSLSGSQLISDELDLDRRELLSLAHSRERR